MTPPTPAPAPVLTPAAALVATPDDLLGLSLRALRRSVELLARPASVSTIIATHRRVMADHAYATRVAAKPSITRHLNTRIALKTFADAAEMLSEPVIELLLLAVAARAQAAEPNTPVLTRMSLEDLDYELRSLARTPAYFGLTTATADQHPMRRYLLRRATEHGLTPTPVPQLQNAA